MAAFPSCADHLDGVEPAESTVLVACREFHAGGAPERCTCDTIDRFGPDG